MIGFGMLLGIFGPLLIIPVIWAVHAWFTRPVLVPRLKARFAALPVGVALAISTLLVFGVLLASYLPGRLTYNVLCEAHATPRIGERVNVDGFYKEELHSYQAARHLYEQGFAFVEAPEFPGKKFDVRYTAGEGRTIGQERVNERLSRYGVREERLPQFWGVMMSKRSVYELGSNRVLAEAASVDYHGGPLFLFFGVHGLSHCPGGIGSDDRGQADFRIYHDLEWVVLRDGATKPPAKAMR